MKLTAASVVMLDATSITAAAYLITLQRYMTNAEISAKFPTTADVPLHLYKCAAELLVGSAAFNAMGFNISTFTNAVIYQSGRSLSQQKFGIEFKETTSEAAMKGKGGDDSDELGAEVGWMKVIMRVEEPDPVIDYPKFLDLRLRYILDFKSRAQCQPQPTWAGAQATAALNPYGIDNTLDPESGLQLEWYDRLDSDGVRERVSLYRGLYDTVYA
jgi:hypothetical protein